MDQNTIIALGQMTAPYGDRILDGRPTELALWHVDRSTFRPARQVTVVQTWTLDFWSNLYRCETEDRQRIDSTDLMDHEPTLVADEAGARYWQ
jgi:hypothetical protein